MEKYALLKEFFGHTAFRPGQESLVDALLSGRDVLGVMPTGAGKSVCYQLPALMLPGLALVVSPLISLMKDQVSALFQAGVPGAYINSSLSYSQYQEVLHKARSGAYKLLYIAPERLEMEGFQAFAQEADISLVAVDEAHCVSQWGQDFRPSYLKIAGFIHSLPRRPAVGAFTATATAQVREDIEKLLELRDPVKASTGFDRPNLFFQVVRPKDKMAELTRVLAQREEQSGVVYCATRKQVEKVYEALRGRGISAAKYHAGLSPQERRDNQEDFVYDRARVMVATNAFGMGIDKSNISFVIHFNMPKNVESYYQEAGRAGRDGSPAYCLLMYASRDLSTARFLIHDSNQAAPEEDRERLLRLELGRLEQMAGYCKSTGCLRAYLLRYFGEEAPDFCGGCGNCTAELQTRDITTEAQKILSAVARVERKYRRGLGTTLIIQMLRGSKDKRVTQLDLDKLPTYGIMKEHSREQVNDYIDCLVEAGCLYTDAGEYPVLRLTNKAKGVLFHGEKVTHLCRAPNRTEKAKDPATPHYTTPADVDQTLFHALRELRGELAEAERVPAYVVFTNAALMDMAAKKPRNMGEFLAVSGVGKVKAKKYGRPFLDRIAQWKKEKREETRVGK